MDEFQQRVLAAVEKPKRNRFLTVINSAFFLWVMSALFLSIGGSYLTNHRQCLDDAEKIIERRNQLSVELQSRNNTVAHRLTEAKTFQEANQEVSTLLLQQPAVGQDKRGSIFSDLSNKTYPELQTEFGTLTDRIKYAEFPDPSIVEYRQKLAETPPDVKLHEDSQQSPPDEGRMLKLMQVAMRLSVAKQVFEAVLDAVGYHFRPNCSIINVAKLTFGYRPPIVFAEINPLYATADGKRAIELAIREVEQKQKDLDGIGR